MHIKTLFFIKNLYRAFIQQSYKRQFLYNMFFVQNVLYSFVLIVFYLNGFYAHGKTIFFIATMSDGQVVQQMHIYFYTRNLIRFYKFCFCLVKKLFLMLFVQSN
jgi:hypothetical protein